VALLGPDGRPLQSAMPAAARGVSSDWVGTFGGQSGWTDRDPWGDGVGYLKSFEQIYRAQPAIAGVVDKLTRRLATLPLSAFQEDTDGSREPLARSHGLQTLLRRPWPGWSKTHLIAAVAQSLLIHGNSLVAKVRTGGREAPVDRLFPLDWSKMGAVSPDGDRIVAWHTTQFGGVQRWLLPQDVIHFAWPPPDGLEIGVSPLEKLGVTIQIEDAAQRHQKAMFRNGTRMSLILALDGNPTPQSLELAQAKVNALHKGVDQSGGTLFVGAPVKPYPMAMTPVEAELINQRYLDWEEVGMVYDMGGPLMNDFRRGTYNNVEELLRALYRDIIPPWTTLIVETLEAQLVDLEERWMDLVVRFDFRDKLRGEPAEQATTLKMLIEAGLLDRDEGREELGKPARGGMAGELTANVNNQAAVQQMSLPVPDPSSSGEVSQDTP
jgi:HK97 family phage portal protein